MLEPNREIWHIINRKDQKTFGDTGNPNKNRFTTALEKNFNKLAKFCQKKTPSAERSVQCGVNSR